MSKPKVMTVYGTRPEAIKVAPVIKALEADDRFESIAVSTGQHKEMLEQVNTMFGIKPAYDLGLMKPEGQGPQRDRFSRVGRTPMRSSTESRAKTSSSLRVILRAAMAALWRASTAVMKVVQTSKRACVTPDALLPIPRKERTMHQDHRPGCVSLHLAPTEGSLENLRVENFRSKDIVVTGNTVIDALLEAAGWDTTFADPKLQGAAASDKRMVVVTTHRRENIDAMKEIGGAVRELATACRDICFALPARTQPCGTPGSAPKVKRNVIITEPLPYNQFTNPGPCNHHSDGSGGVRKSAISEEASSRDAEHRTTQAVVASTVKLVGTNRSAIVAGKQKLLLDDKAAFEAMANAVNPYGDGRGAERSVAAIGALLGLGERVENFSPEPGTEDERIPRFEEIVSGSKARFLLDRSGSNFRH